MMRTTTPAASMQKTYDDCYLICSTAVYFENQVRLLSALIRDLPSSVLIRRC